jgi:hypothetical protein
MLSLREVIKTKSNNHPVTYRIEVYGHLYEKWFPRLTGVGVLTVHYADDLDTTNLNVELADQAALIGILNMLYDFGYPLLSVMKLTEQEIN